MKQTTLRRITLKHLLHAGSIPAISTSARPRNIISGAFAIVRDGGNRKAEAVYKTSEASACRRARVVST